MASVNKVILIGNLGRDPEVRYTPGNLAICTISIATTRNSKNRDSGDRMEETEWHRVVFFDRLAEIAGEYLKKGRSVYVEGRLRTRKWQDKDGKDQYTTEVVAEQMQMLGPREDGGGDRQQGERGSQSTSRNDDNRSRQQSGRSSGGGEQQRRTNTGFDEMDDDIPFVTSSMACDLTMPTERRMRRYRYA